MIKLLAVLASCMIASTEAINCWAFLSILAGKTPKKVVRPMQKKADDDEFGHDDHAKQQEHERKQNLKAGVIACYEQGLIV